MADQNRAQEQTDQQPQDERLPAQPVAGDSGPVNITGPPVEPAGRPPFPVGPSVNDADNPDLAGRGTTRDVTHPPAAPTQGTGSPSNCTPHR
jgi:hypothetical protein